MDFVIAHPNGWGLKEQMFLRRAAIAARYADSVAMVATNIFQINRFSVRNKIGKIGKIFVKIEDPENRGVI